MVDQSNTSDLPQMGSNVIQHSISLSRWRRAWFLHHIFRLGLRKIWFPVLGQYIDDVDVVLALGGDNYSMDYGSLRTHLAYIDYTLARNKPFIIWGGSVGPFDKFGPEYESQVAQKLRMVTAILAREDVTVEYLARIGVTDNVRRVADPAFLMKPTKPQIRGLPFDSLNRAIGLNFSPLMARYITDGDVKACSEIVVAIVKSLLTRFDRPVILIPHVHKPSSDDYAFLESVYQIFHQSDAPVYLLSRALNAPEVKWVMRELACFAGARMHSTIAALSSGVPTLSFSYSIKSVGLNRDLFGHEDYMLPPKRITPEKTVQKIGLILRDRKSIRQEIESRMPIIEERAYHAGKYLRSILRTGKLCSELS
jgi:polysaccharide pyruvyl transferase WcaK-like protein